MNDPTAALPVRPPASMLALVAGFASIYLIWGSTYLGIKFAVETIPPLLMAGTRFLLAGLVLYLIVRLRGVSRPDRRQWTAATVTGAFLLVGGNGLVTWAARSVPSGVSALAVATTPLWMVLLDWLAFQGDRPAPRIGLGLAVGFGGAALLLRPDALQDRPGHLVAVLAVIAAAMLWSVGSLLSRRAPPTPSPLLTSAMQMIAGGTLMLLAGLLRGEGPQLADAVVSTRSALALTYLTLIGSLVGFSTYVWLLRAASPAAVSTYAYVNPLVAVFLGWLLGGEKLDRTMAVAACFIVAAVALVVSARGNSRLGPSREGTKNPGVDSD